MLERPPNLAGAIEQYQEAVAADPQNIALQLRLAELLKSAHRPQNALAQLTEASRQAPESVLILERLGDLQAELNNTEAKSTYERAAQAATDPKTRARLTAKAGKQL